jgi:hypothetical protein
MLGISPTLKGFFPGDDAQDVDIYSLSALNVNPNSATDLLWNGQGTAGPVTPVNYVAMIYSLWLVNKGASAGSVTIYSLNTQASTSSFTPIGEYYLAAGGAFQVSNERFRLVAPPNCKFQVLSSVTADVIANARYLKGAGQ